MQKLQGNGSSKECHQHKIKMKHRETDLVEFETDKQLELSELEFRVIFKSENDAKNDVINFIEKYEWLGKINNYWNYAFALTYQDKIVNVVMIGTPAMFTKVIGENTTQYEQTIHRGASCSIAPKNSGSFLIAKALDWMVNNTPYRLFYGYSTPSGANEYGYIYQSLGFNLISKNAGTKLEYLKPNTTDRWLSDRHLRKLSNYKKIAKKLGFKWQGSWNTKWKIHWDKMPEEVSLAIKLEQKEEMKSLKFRKVEPKFRYLKIKGKDKRETKHLIRLFKENNPKLVNEDGSLGLPYPKKDQII